MIAVFKREFRALFQYLTGSIFLAVYFLALGIFVTASQFMGHSAAFHFNVSNLALILALLIPILTMGLFAAEQKEGSARLLQALPLSQTHILMGKYLACFSVIAIAIGGTAIFPVFLSLFGKIDLGAAYLSLLGLLLFSAMLLALGVLFAALCRRVVFCALWIYATEVLFFLFGILEFLRPDALTNVPNYLAAFLLFDHFAMGLLDIAALIFFISVTVFALSLALLIQKRRARDPYALPSAKRSLPTAVSCILLVAALLAVNVGAALIPRSVSLTDPSHTGRYTLSKTGQNYLKSLSEDVTMYIVNDDGSDPSFRIFLNRFSQYGSHVKLKNLSTVKDAELLTSLGCSSEVSPYSIVLESEYRTVTLDYMQFFTYQSSAGDSLSVSDYYYMLQYVTQYQGTSQYESYLQQLSQYHLYFGGESMILSAMEYVLIEQLPTAYLLTGNGEDDPSAGNLGATLANIGLQVKPLTINDEAVIPENACCLILNSPTEDYSEAEAAILRAYLEKGGNLLLITSPENAAMPNLSALMAHYGVTAETGVITMPADEETTETEESDSAEEETEEVDLTIITPTIHNQHEVLSEVTSGAFTIKNAQSLLTDASLRKGLLITPLLTSPETALLGEQAGSYTVAVAIEEPSENTSTKIVWFTGGETFNGEKATTSNMYLPLYGINWLFENYETALGGITPTPYETGTLSMSEMSAAWLSVLVILLIPAGIITPGILIYLKRKKR